LIDVLWRGGRIGYEPAAVVYHRHRHEYPALLHQLRGNGTGFVAMLVSLITHDPRHLLGLAAQMPLAAQRMLAQSTTRLRGGAAGRSHDHNGQPHQPAAPSYLPDLVKQELRGMTAGVTSYLASRRAVRAWAPQP
jgi:hypothetical protein